MSVVDSICDKLASELEGKHVCLESIQLACSSPRDKQLLPATLVCESAVVVFVHAEPSERDSTSLKIRLRNVLNVLINRLDVSVNSFIMCVCLSEQDSEGLEYAEIGVFNAYNERINYYSCKEQLDDFLCVLAHDLKHRRPVFDEYGVSHVAFNLQLMTSSNGAVKKSENGEYFIKKHGYWYEASEHDPDEMFSKAALYGAFGGHKFLDDRKLVGLVYFFTCGFFGVAWLLDCVAMLLGIYKDRENKYLLPVTVRKDCLMKMLIGLAITAAYIVVCIILLSFLGELLNGAINGVISSNSDSLSSLAELHTP